MATEKETLQETVLNMGLETKGVDGKELTIAQLKEVIGVAAAVGGKPTVAPSDDAPSDADPDADPEDDASPELIALQDEAMQIEVDIYAPGDDGAELSIEELQVAVDAKVGELKAKYEAEQKEAKAARRSAKKANRDAKKARDDADRANHSPTTSELGPELGLGTSSAADKKLAEKHGYPVVIPGAKAYRTSIRFNCVYGGGLRKAGTIVLLTDAHARNKMEYLEPVK